MGKSSIQPPVGEVVLINKKPAAEAPKVREISQKEYERMRPKKEISDKQKENLAKLIEKNKAKALERRVTIKDALPDEIPEDKELVIVKPKRKYVRKNKIIIPPASSDVESGMESEPITESEYTESESEVEVRKPIRRKPVKKPVKQPPKYRYESETTTTDNDSSDDESDEDDDPKVKKYQAKAQARLQAVQQIDQRIQQIKNNPYTAKGLTIF